ncbi:unnamed protein product [Gongylonema pulchrum]|uniref:Transposase n=1 Tax=Gongylonema pulchrum TaxID=637853 RepID=A0A183E5Z2_9BILA|nr:unnamed protein product [Gongylonema pulchrum]
MKNAYCPRFDMKLNKGSIELVRNYTSLGQVVQLNNAKYPRTRRLLHLQKQQFTILPSCQPCYMGVKRGTPRLLKNGNWLSLKEQWSGEWLALAGYSTFQMKCYEPHLA